MADPLILYSANTWLAWAIAERYYHSTHYVWCSPFFRPRQHVSPAAMPPTSIPGEIYDGFLNDVQNGDRHSHWIEKNKAGILAGSEVKYRAGIISDTQKDEIYAIVNGVEVRDFRPLIFVMPFELVKHDVVSVPPPERAHPMAEEYRLEQLDKNKFDIIEPRRS